MWKNLIYSILFLIAASVSAIDLGYVTIYGTDTSDIKGTVTNILGTIPITWDVEIVTTTSNTLFSITPTTTNLSIYWGDGSVSNVSATNRVNHYYVTPATYTLGLIGSATRIRFGHDVATRGLLKKIINTANIITGFSSFANTFENCTALTIIPSNLFTGLTAISNLTYAWSGCSGITNLPAVSMLTNITSLYSTWYGCASASNFPTVDTLINVTILQSAWQSCAKMKSVPDISTLTKVTTVDRTWSGCSLLTNVPDLTTLTNLNKLGGAWMNCSSVASFPVISHLTNVTDLAYSWFNCTGASNFPVISTLTKVNSLDRTWTGCSKGTNFPDVSTLTNVTILEYTWGTCSGAYTFPAITNLARVNTLAFTWQGCTKLTNFTDFSTLTNVSTFNGTWYGCTNITGQIPTFSNNINANNFGDTFYNCTNIIGDLSIFANHTNITTWSSRNTSITYTNTSGVGYWPATNVKNSLSFRMDNSRLPQAQVSQVLMDLDRSGASSGVCNLGGTNYPNGTPNAAGYTAMSNLILKSWTVTVN